MTAADATVRPVPTELGLTTGTFATLDAPYAVDLAGAVSGETVRLFASFGIGPGPCNPSGTACLDISGPVMRLGSETADVSGTAFFTVAFPSSHLASGDQVALQGLAVRGAGGADSVGSSPVLVTMDGDVDGDGVWLSGGDCDDDDPSVLPGAAEVCGDGVDQDCDGLDATCLVGGARSLASADAKLLGEAGGDDAGWSVSVAGDTNGDGFDDLFVGAREQDATRAGAAYLVLGPASGTVDLAAADAKLTGETSTDWAGTSVAGAGDVDGDGFDDLLVGADGYDSPREDAGAAYLIRGPVSGTLDLGASDAKFVGESRWDDAGECVASPGDVNGDGFSDLLIGAPGYGVTYYSFDGGDGRAYLLFGPFSGTRNLASADAIFRGENDGGRAGTSVSGAGDVDGDGLVDILIGAPALGSDWYSAGSGAVYLILAPTAGSRNLATADAKLTEAASGGYPGKSATGAGDVNGDGFDDLLIGDPYADGSGTLAGEAYIVHGPVSGTLDLSYADTTFLGESDNDYAGMSVSAAGDVDGDGFADVLIGASSYASDGAAYLVLGPGLGAIDLADAEVILLGEATTGHAGQSVSGAGDVDGDGTPDLLIGAPDHDATGAAYLLSGASL